MATDQPTMQPTAVEFEASPYGDALRIAAVFIMFTASFLGVILPLWYYGGGDKEKHQSLATNDGFRIMRSFAAGVMLGVAFVHLLFEGNEKLSEVSIDYPALAFTVATMGTMFVLGCEQLMATFLRVPVENLDASPEESNEHSYALKTIARSDSLSVIVKAYMMEFSVAIHSVIIGLALGYMSGKENLEELQVLIIAIVFHQFFEGVGLGTTLQEARLELGKWQIILFVLIFSSMLSFGIVIGILITYYNEEAETTNELYINGCLNALAAGILIYIALVEMIAEDFHAAAIANRVWLKVQMMIALMLGTMFLAVLAIWA